MLAALGRHTDCVHILLEKGATADAADKKGFTAFHRAVSTCCTGVYVPCHFLTALNNVNEGYAPFQSPGSSRCFSFLFFSRLKSCVFLLQAILGSEDCVSALLEHGASPLCRDSKGRTPLHFAASRGHTKLLQTLLKAAMKADPLDSILDFRGYTPTHWAAHHGELSGKQFMSNVLGSF